MSLNSKLQALKSVLSEILNNANEILVDKGKEPANNIEMALNDIALLPSGDDELARIALEAPTEGEKGTVDLKLDSSWGNLKPYAFYANEKLKSVDLSDCVNMTEMPIGCFSSSSTIASNLTTFIFPPNIKNIAGLARTRVEEIRVPSEVETVKECSNNDYLKSVIFPTDSKVREIAEYAFEGCGGLAQIVLPPVLKTLNNHWIYLSLKTKKKIYFRNKPKYVKNNALSSAGVTDIYVPWSKDEVAGAPWGATNASIYYDFKMFNHIEITTLPNNLAFVVGESFDPTGMTVTFFETDESVDAKMTEIPIENLEFSQEPFTNDDLGDEVPFYIYYTALDGSRYIADIEINISQA